MTYPDSEIDRLADAITEYATAVNGASIRQIWAAQQAAERFSKRAVPPPNLVLAWAEETLRFTLSGENWRNGSVVTQIINRELAA